MKKSLLLLIVFFLVQQVFASPSQLLNSITISSATYHLEACTSNATETKLWPRRRRGCHGGKKQKRRNKRRIKRSRKS